MFASYVIISEITIDSKFNIFYSETTCAPMERSIKSLKSLKCNVLRAHREQYRVMNKELQNGTTDGCRIPWGVHYCLSQSTGLEPKNAVFLEISRSKEFVSALTFDID